MARRKKGKSHKRTTRRRRVGATAMSLNPNSPVVMIGSAAIGYLFADKINTALANVTGTMDAKLVGAIEAGLGGALVFNVFGGKKSLPLTVAGGVIGGAGVKKLLEAFGIINGIGGYGAVPVIGRRMMKGALNGYGQVPVVAGYSPNQSLNGVGAFQVPPVPKMNVMGSTSGSGLLESALME